MRLVHLDDVELVVRKTVRSTIDYRSLLAGTPGAIDNFKLIIATTHADYTTPRHRHNFDQIRLQVSGSFDYDGIGTMTEGMVGYFPEGTPYGPSASSDGSTILLLQHAGASGSGYLRRRIQCQHCRAETEGQIPRGHLHGAGARRS